MGPISQDEYARAIERATLWMMRAKVATALATYFCETGNYTGAVVDIRWEVEHQAERLIKELHTVEGGPERVRKQLEELKRGSKRRKK